MNFTTFLESYSKKKPGSDILQRWNERLVTTGWAAMGRQSGTLHLANCREDKLKIAAA